MLLPLPSPVLDLLLTAQLAAAIVLLWVVATAAAPSRLTGLPTALMALTLLRLALNVATTRAILARGEAGRVVEAFGDVLVGGDLLVGLAIFAVVTLAQYAVVARGAGRVAEVAARFALDALPGRLQAIEAELRAGSLDAEGARRRRQTLERTSGLYGAMDGVMRFVRGDALAGLGIVLIDIIGGLAIGIGRWGLDPDTALATYTVLTVGDGLAAQVPAVMGTAAAAVLAIRLAAPEAPEARGESGHGIERALGGAAVLFGGLAVVPGLPLWPLLVVGGALGAAALMHRRSARAGGPAPPEAETAALALDLHPDAWAALGGQPDAVVGRARALVESAGARWPGVRVRVGAPDVPPSGYRIAVGGAPVAHGLAPSQRVFVCPCPEDRRGLGGRHPIHGAPGRWVEHGAGLAPPEALAAHLAAAWCRDRAALDLQTVADRLQSIEGRRPAAVRAVVPRRISLEALTALLRRLLAEGLPVADLATILEALAEQPEQAEPESRLPRLRRALRPWITARFVAGRWLAVIHVGVDIERALAADALGIDGLAAVVHQLDDVRAAHPRAVLVVADARRDAIQAALAEHQPGLPVLAHGEVEPGVATRAVGVVLDAQPGEREPDLFG